jgi:transposase InsO family protein
MHEELPAVSPDETLLSQHNAMGKRQLLLDKFLDVVVAGYVADTKFDGHALGLEQVGQFWFKDNALALPDHLDVRSAAMYQMHDAPWAAHVGRNRMIAALRSAYWWPTLDADVRKYVGSCDLCQRNKARHTPKENYLAPLPVPERPFQTIGIDFITQLPTTPRGYDAICVIVCHFTKLAHFIPCHTTTNAKQFSTIFRKHFWRLHGLPMHIVSDRGSQFIADFWQQLCSDLGVKLRLTSSHQPSTDGQVERMNKVLEEALRSYVDVLHTDWDEWLDCVEFANNKSVAASHGMTPFSLVYHHEPMTPPDLALIQGLPLRSRASDINPTVPTLKTRAGRKHCVSWITKYTTARQILQQAKDRMCATANKSRVHREFAIGDMVVLNTKTFRLKKPAPSEKFLPLYCGPFRITERIGLSAYRLALPATCRIHPVVHVSKLWRYLARPGEVQPPPPILLENSEQFKVLDILTHRGSAPRRQYLVQWKGLDVLYNTWEPESSLSACSELLSAYHSRAASSLPLLRSDCYVIRVAGSLGGRTSQASF